MNMFISKIVTTTKKILTSGKHFFILIILSAALLLPNQAFANKNIIEPDRTGSYNVGFTTFNVTGPVHPTAFPNGRSFNVTVWYPTKDAPNNSPDNVYDVPTSSSPASFKPFLTQTIKDASVAEGNFPMIIVFHGGGADETGRFVYWPTNEMLASHGFIVVGFKRSGFCLLEPRDPRFLIDYMIQRSNTSGDIFYQKIKANNVGAMGTSAGGLGLISLASGISTPGPTTGTPLTADERVKAMVLYEPSISGQGCAPSFPSVDIPKISIPYLIMGGAGTLTSSPGANFVGSVKFFNDTPQALPRFHVQTTSKEALAMGMLNASHYLYTTGVCPVIDQLREVSLERQIAANLIPLDPLTNAINPAIDQNAGATAKLFWDITKVNGGSSCNRVGVNSAIIPLDTNGDGLTDSPPLIISVPAPIPGDKMVQITNWYTVAFFKSYLEGDHRYNRYLSEGAPVTNNLDAIVTKVEE